MRKRDLFFKLNIECFEPLIFFKLFKKQHILFSKPEVKKLITVIKSPFIFKKASRNQFELIKYNISIDLNSSFKKWVSPFLLEWLLLLLLQENLSALTRVSLTKAYKNTTF